VDVTPVGSRRELREFIELPFRLHSNRPQWVPPLRLERHAFLSRRLNPFFRHGEARLFLARRDGRVVGRISAQVDHAYQRYHGTREGMFGFLELEDDLEVMRALLDAAAGWLRARGCDTAIGPMDFTMNDESGIVIEGHDRPPFIRQPWHPPYYQRLCEAAGLTKAKDLNTWEMEIGDRERILPIIFELDRKAREEHGIRIRHMTRRSLRRDLDAFADVYNAAWANNWGFAPLSREDLDGYARSLQFVFHPDWFMIAETRDGEVAGVGISVLDINQVLRRMNGRLLPFGWWWLLRRNRIIDAVRVGFLGVHPDHQHTGVAASLYIEHYNRARRDGVWWGEMGWILEDNPINRGMEALGGRLVKRFRVYRLDLGAGAGAAGEHDADRGAG
jgi:GNAT superfamily N-acetyltransferase